VDNIYGKILKKHGKKAADKWWREKKTKERLEQLDKDYPMDRPVFDKGQTGSMFGGSYISKKPKDNGVYNKKNTWGKNTWEKNIKSRKTKR
jgi:hypothetical protein